MTLFVVHSKNRSTPGSAIGPPVACINIIEDYLTQYIVIPEVGSFPWKPKEVRVFRFSFFVSRCWLFVS